MSNKLNHFKKSALLSALILEMSSGAQAATIIVDNTSCTLANAIIAANDDVVTAGCTAGSGTDDIELPQSSIVDLMTALPANEGYLTINCNNSTIQRNSAADAFPIFINDDISELRLNDCVISNGESSNNNTNTGGGVTSGVYSNLFINRSIITGNLGGGVYSYNGNIMEITDSIISSNTGHPNASSMSAGISLYGGGSVRITNTTINENKTYGDAEGGGVFVSENYFQGSFLRILNSTISNNSTSFGGGGIHMENGEAGEPGIKIETYVKLTNVTLVNNTTQQNGGGINNIDAELVIENSIISGNNADDDSMSQADEILSTNTVTLAGFNLIGLNAEAGVYGFTIDQNSTNAVIQEPNLSDVVDTELKNNGGLTPTHALTLNSPAIDFIPIEFCVELTDQTGKARPLDGNDDGTVDCDAGAFENKSDLIFEDGFE